jgi:hypothetical protein
MGKSKKPAAKLPYMKWYPADLDAEPTLRFCSWEAGFLWVKMLGFMHHSPERGFLIKQNGKPYTEEDLVKSVHGATLERVRNCLFELESNAVFSRDRRGTIYSRKIVKGELRARNLEKRKGHEKGSKREDKGDLTSNASTGNERENSNSGDRSVVKPEARSQSLERKKERGVEAPRGAAPPISDPEIQMAFSAFNRAAELAGIPVAQHLTETRKKKFKQRLRECGGLAGWNAALEKLSASAFMRGNNDRGWRADLDFILQEKSFTRLLEGFYDNQPTKGKQHGKSIAEQGRELVDSLGKGGAG